MQFYRINSIMDVMKREIQQVIRDKDLIIIVLLVPVFYLLFYSALYKNKVINSLNVGIIDRDQSHISLFLKKQIMADPVLQSREFATLEEAKNLMEEQKLQAVLYIPEHFEKDFKRGLQVTIPLYISTTNFMVNIEANKRLGGIVNQLNYHIAAKYWMSQSLHREAAMVKILPTSISIHPVGNAAYSYGDFVITGLVMLILQQLLLIGLAESVALEREKASLSNWFQTAKNSIFKMIAGKSMPYILLYLIYFLFTVDIVLPLFKIENHGSRVALILFAIVFFFAISNFGVFLGSFFTKKIQALQILGVTSIPFFLMSGYSWPYFVLPKVIQWLNYLLPTYWMLMPFQNMVRIGAPFYTQLHYLGVLVFQGILYAFLAGRRIRKLTA